MIIGDQEVHIGKASGRQFLFSGYHYNSVDKWKLALKMYGIIKDEYGEQISVTKFLRIVERSKPEVTDDPQLPGWYIVGGYYFYDGEFS